MQKFVSFYFSLIIFSVAFTSCNTTSRIDHTETQQYPLNKPGYTLEDSSMVNLMSPYKHVVDSAMDVFLIKSENAMERKTPEGLLGNIVADLTLEQANKIYNPVDGKKIDFCFLNNGGLRAPLPKGDITRRNIFELMPFENEMIVVTLNGPTTKKLFDFIAAKGGMPISFATLKIKDNLANAIMIGGSAFDTTKVYKVVTSDYLANGGDNLSLMNDALKKEYPGMKLRDALINGLIEKNKKGESLNAKIEGRITLE